MLDLFGRFAVGFLIGGISGFKLTNIISFNPGGPMGGVGKGILQFFAILYGGIAGMSLMVYFK